MPIKHSEKIPVKLSVFYKEWHKIVSKFRFVGRRFVLSAAIFAFG